MSQRRSRNRNNASGIRGLYLKKGLYVYQPPMRDGQRPPAIHLRTADLPDAMAQIAALTEQGFARAETEPLALLIERFLADKLALGEHKTQKTSRSARAGLDRFARHFSGCRPGAIDAGRLREWKSSMLEENLSRASIAGYMRYAQSFCSWLVRERHLIRNPFTGQKSLFPKSIPTRREGACTKAERDRLITTCDYLPLKAVFYLGFYAGLRRAEILAMRREWIEVDHATGRPLFIHIQNDDQFSTKDSEAKRVPVSRALGQFLMEEYGLAHDPYFIRPELPRGRHEYRWDWKRRWATHVAAQGLPWVTAHTMRHTWFTLLLSAPRVERPSLLHLSRWSGTGVETIKKHYAHLLDDRELIDVAD